MNFKVIHMAKGQELPQFKENRNGNWIDYGNDNLYPQYLLDVFHHRSNKHKAIINRKVDMTVGNGIQTPTTPELQKFIKNPYGQKDLEEISVHIDFDFEIMNGFALIVRWNVDGTRIAALDWMPFHKCRLSPDEKKVLISKDWSNWRKTENKPVEFCRFDPLKAKEFPTQIFYYVQETNGVEYYPLPYYSSTLTWIELDYEVGNFHLSSVRNGFMPGFILNFATGIPTPEEMAIAYKQFEDKYTGSENAGKFILTFSEGQDQKPEFIPINLNDSDERFIMLHKEMMEEIFIGHSVTDPQLFGVRVPGELGGKDQLLQNLAIFQSTYISNKQKVLQKQLDKLARFAGVVEPIIFNKYAIDFGNVEAVQENLNKTELFAPCWEGYEMVGMKIVDGREVPNCVPVKEMSIEAPGVAPYVEEVGKTASIIKEQVSK